VENIINIGGFSAQRIESVEQSRLLLGVRVLLMKSTHASHVDCVSIAKGVWKTEFVVTGKLRKTRFD
jgi:hypothetical protein